MYSKQIRLLLDKTNQYYYFCDSNHPLSNSQRKVLFHRHVASLKEKRWLDKNEVVHHIDGDRLNNSEDNLVVTTKSLHAKLHKPSTIKKLVCICGKTFKGKKNKTKYCSEKCHHLASRRFDIDKEELEGLVWEFPLEYIGQLYNVSGNAIKSRCKSLGITKPEQGHWVKKYGVAHEPIRPCVTH